MEGTAESFLYTVDLSNLRLVRFRKDIIIEMYIKILLIVR